MAETGLHVNAIVNAFITLEIRFAKDRWTHVGANMFLYYQEGDPSKRFTPHLFVVRGLETMPEESYRIWETGRPPTLYMEMASLSTEKLDCGAKQAMFASMGVREYWRFNPEERLEGARRPGVRLEGGRLQGLGYEPLPEGPDGSIRSEVLELDVRTDRRLGQTHLLRFRDPQTGSDLLTFREVEERRIAAEADRRAAEERRLLAEVEQVQRDREAEIAQLQDQIAKLEAARSSIGADSRP